MTSWKTPAMSDGTSGVEEFRRNRMDRPHILHGEIHPMKNPAMEIPFFDTNFLVAPL